MNSYEHFILLYCIFYATVCIYTESSIFLCEYSKDASIMMK